VSISRIAWVMWAISIALSAIALGLLFVSFGAPVPDSWGFRGFTTTFAVGFSTVGLVIVLARRNLVGWILLVAGLLSGLQDFSEEYAIYGVLARPGSVPAPEIFAWIESWIWVCVVVLVAIYLPLWFPNGHFSSPRWRILGLLTLVVSVALVAGLAFSEGPMNNAPFVSNPFGIRGLRVIDVGGPEAEQALPQNSPAFFALYVGLFACALGAVWSLVGRFRVARGVERQQIKWFAFGAGFAAIAMIVGGTLQQYKAAQVLFILAIEVIPISVAIAVLRYRLYDIDVVINRALVYGVTVAIVGAGFVAAALFLQTLLRPITAGSDLAIAVSTLATVAAFQPLRRWVQGAIDRRFYRSRYDAARTLDSFSSRLRDEVDVDALRSELLEVIGETVRPTHASVWLRRSGP
jgi:hypothetical protein